MNRIGKMDFETLRHEGPMPAISPNAGARRILCWTRSDMGAFGDALRKAFPNVLFFEDFRHPKWTMDAPRPRFLERLDDPTIVKNIEIIFPFHGWRPELASVSNGPGPYARFWTWSNYLSPIATIWMNARDTDVMSDWNGRTMEVPIESWREGAITTSYRREIREERKIAEKVIRIAERSCIRMVPVGWNSYDEFRERAGGISLVGLRYGFGWVTSAVIDWYRAAPNRAIKLTIRGNNYGSGNLPVEDVPDSWWEGIRRPKWAQPKK